MVSINVVPHTPNLFLGCIPVGTPRKRTIVANSIACIALAVFALVLLIKFNRPFLAVVASCGVPAGIFEIKSLTYKSQVRSLIKELRLTTSGKTLAECDEQLDGQLAPEEGLSVIGEGGKSLFVGLRRNGDDQKVVLSIPLDSSSSCVLSKEPQLPKYTPDEMIQMVRCLVERRSPLVEYTLIA